MRKNVTKVVLFMLGLCLLLTGVSFLVKPQEDVYDILAVQRKINAVKQEKENSLDVLFVGDSESCDVYSPLQLWGEYGITSYNTGSRAQRISDGYAIVKETLKTQKPKLIVIEANTLFRKNDIYNKEDANELFARIFPILHYHSFYKLWEMKEVVSGLGKEREKAEYLKGFWLRETQRSYRGSKDYIDRNKKDSTITEGTKKYLDALVSLAKENDIQVLLVASPSPLNWSRGRQTTIENYAQDHNLLFMDLNEKNDQMAIDWKTDTMDRGDHVNFAGSKKVNHYLGQWIQEIYQLEDHRQDASYSDWNELYQEVNLY